MRRRLLISTVVLVTLVLLALEVPLALVYARHEHDSLNGGVQRDAASLGSLSEEVIEHQGEHDAGQLAQRFTAANGTDVVILDRAGNLLSSASSAAAASTFSGVLDQARRGQSVTGERDGRVFATVPVGGAGDTHGAVLIARPDDASRRVHQFWVILFVIAVAVLAFAMLMSHRLARWVVDPLQRLDDQAADLGRGDLHVRADIDHAPPEIATLAETFNEMADQLDQLVTSQRRFVADASHQLRTPLTALRLRLENLDPSDPQQVIATRDAALHETSRLTRLVDGLLALARAERTKPVREPVDVSAVLVERYETWAPLAAERGIDLRLDTNGAHPVEAMAVPGQLEQILDNLIDNAIDATPQGRGVRLRVARATEAAEVHVIDDGPGMTEEQRRHAFAPFWQGSRHGANGNSGLGLAIVEQLVRSSHGTVSLERSESGGIDATVRLTLVSD